MTKITDAKNAVKRVASPFAPTAYAFA